ncbi:hypothetical protein BD779DRAFT_1443864, partial [Infundibulicybe gibba]
KALAPHISAFAELHAGLERIPDSERGKVLQSIASVIQAMPPDQEIPPIEAIVNPIIAKLADALRSAPEVHSSHQLGLLSCLLLSSGQMRRARWRLCNSRFCPALPRALRERWTC